MNNQEVEEEDLRKEPEGDPVQEGADRPPLNQDPEELVVGDPKVADEKQDEFDKWVEEDDIYIYSGEINSRGADWIIDLIEQRGSRKNASLVLTTYGGDGDAAYRIARQLRRSYDVFSLYVYGSCKSAGTLIALGAHRIVMFPQGEFGPLDVQLLREDDNIVSRRSGLDVFQTLSMLRQESLALFESQFLEILRRSLGGITTKTAGELAGSLTVGLLSPITAQLDPYKLGEIQRSVNVARDYGNRLNNNPGLVSHLIHNYPSHSFVIDSEEAKPLFENVYDPVSYEIGFLGYMADVFTKQYGYNVIRYPYNQSPFITLINPPSPQPPQEQPNERANQQDGEADGDAPNA